MKCTCNGCGEVKHIEIKFTKYGINICRECSNDENFMNTIFNNLFEKIRKK